MTLDATQAVVAGSGHIYVADEGTPLPDDLSDLSADPDFTELGFTTTDGVTFNLARQTTDINAWQSPDPIRIVETSRAITIASVLEQYIPENLEVAFGGGVVDKGPTFGSFTYPGAGENTVRVLVVDAIDGDDLYRFMYDRVQQMADIQTQLQRGDTANLPLEFKVLAGAELPTILSDAAAWISASS
jgi:hypothetical protein